MTDNEIINALELCATLDSGNCKKCPCREICNENDGTLTKLTLDLINRQKAENDSLKVDLAKCSIRLDNLYKTADEIKSEAIKEFAERLKDEMRLEDDCRYDCMNCLYECKGYVPLIDNLVKEMTEEKEK